MPLPHCRQLFCLMTAGPTLINQCSSAADRFYRRSPQQRCVFRFEEIQICSRQSCFHLRFSYIIQSQLCAVKYAQLCAVVTGRKPYCRLKNKTSPEKDGVCRRNCLLKRPLIFFCKTKSSYSETTLMRS